MSDPRHQRAKELFLSALELEREARPAYLERVCGEDGELRAEVESLLEEGDADTGLFAPLLAEAAELGHRALQERFEPGARIADRYEVVQRLGAGGMGEVYLARDERVGVDVALKFLPHALLDHPGAMELLVSEARLAREITHPGVCRVYDVGEVDGEPFLTMEFIEGEDLSAFLHRAGRLEPSDVRRMATELCAALAAAHAQGVLHRDFKPGNVIVDRAGGLHVTDFGLAGYAGEVRADYPTAGSPAYMAPELLRGEPPTVQSDLFGLGLVLYELAVRRRAFPNARAILTAADEHAAPPIPLPEADPVVSRILRRTLSPDPVDRPRSAADLEAALSEPDDLSALLRLGELPSPELVAASGAHGLLDRRRAGRVFAAILLGMAALVPLAGRLRPVQRAGPPLAPAESAARAELMLDELVSTGDIADRHWDYTGGVVLRPIEVKDERYRLRSPREGTVDLRFWYRRADRALTARMAWTLFYSEGRVQANDPPLDTPGVDTLVLDPQGRLELFVSRPPEGAEPAEPGAPDWAPFFARAGLDPQDFEPFEVSLGISSVGDRGVAFRGQAPEVADLHVECSSLGRSPVLFAVLQRERESDVAWRVEVRREWSGWLFDALYSTLIAFAVVIGWRNLRTGRGDPWGALRLAVVVLLLRLVNWALRTSHSPDMTEETTLLILALAAGLFDALLVWGFYMGVEPLVRRHWPRVLVSWSRLLQGQISDPLVSSHVLIGIGFGVWFAILSALDVAGPLLLGSEVDPGVSNLLTRALSGVAGWLSVPMDDAVDALRNALLAVALLAVLRFFVRRTRLAVALAVLLLGTVDVLAAQDPAVSWITIGLGQLAVGYLVVMRFGLLSYAVALFTQYVLEDFPLTPDLGVWYSASTPFVVLAVVGLAALAVRAVPRMGESEA